jgi:hypothetical protein
MWVRDRCYQVYHLLLYGDTLCDEILETFLDTNKVNNGVNEYTLSGEQPQIPKALLAQRLLNTGSTYVDFATLAVRHHACPSL